MDHHIMGKCYALCTSQTKMWIWEIPPSIDNARFSSRYVVYQTHLKFKFSKYPLNVSSWILFASCEKLMDYHIMGEWYALCASQA